MTRYEDRWPLLAPRLAYPAAVAAAAETDVRAIDASSLPIPRHLIAHPGDMPHRSSLLEYLQNLLAREERRTALVQNSAEQAGLETQEAVRQLAALCSPMSWRMTAPLRWLSSAFRGPR